jgi:Acyl-coenzyme A synthetases/AMP-(fatty) acid ligases
MDTENCDRSLLLKKLNAQLKSNVPPFALPSKIFFLDSLPKTRLGKSMTPS